MYPKIALEKIDYILRHKKQIQNKADPDVKIEYPGESTSLALAILISIIVLIAFSIITIGVFFFYLCASSVYLRLRHLSTRSNCVRCSEKAYPEIYNLSKLAAYLLKIPLCPVYIELNPIINAYTAGFWGDHWIVLYSGLLKQLELDDILFVVGHEMGHIKREHATWLSLSSPACGISIPVLTDILRVIFNNWHLKSEYTADRAGLIATGNLSTCVSSLLKLIGENNSIKAEEIIRDFEKKSKDPMLKIAELFQDHPFIPNRVIKLRDFACKRKESLGV
jgi:Zn-dependent protease with chaperone function